MRFKEFINELLKTGQAKEVYEILDPRFEISSLLRVAQEEGYNAALIVKNPKGHQRPVVGNVFLQRERIAHAFKLDSEKINEAYKEKKKHPPKLKKVSFSPWKISLNGGVDVLKYMPILTHHEFDVGPYLTSAVVVARDPESGQTVLSINRIQIKDKHKFGILIANPPLLDVFSKAEKDRKTLEVAILNGVDPAVFLAAILPTEEEKLHLAAKLSVDPIETTSCRFVNLEVPINAEYVLEAVIFPDKREKEGPFGENTGYYIEFENPVGEILALHMYEDSYYHALLPFSKEADLLLNLAWELEKLEHLKNIFPSVLDLRFMHMRFLAVVQVKDTEEKEIDEILEYLLSQRSVKVVIAVDEDVNLNNDYELFWALATRLDVDNNIIIRKNKPGSWIDPFIAFSTYRPSGLPTVSKIAIKALKPKEQAEKFKKVHINSFFRKKVMHVFRQLR